MKCEEIIELLELHSPVRYACDWDNVGLLIGDRSQEIHSVFIALDATDEVIDHAIQAGANLLITHHPLLFRGIKRITADDFIGRRLMRLISENISCYAMHTNFDVSQMGRLAADQLGLTQQQPLEITLQEDSLTAGIGTIGILEREITLAECAALVKDKFSLPGVRIFGNQDSLVKKVAMVPGSGKSNIKDAVRENADVFITGDIDHHEGIDAVAQGLCIIDAGHYGLEQVFLPFLAEYLSSNTKGIKITTEPLSFPFDFA